MFRCVRIWTGDNENSQFEEGMIDLGPATGDILLAEDTVGGGHSWRIIDDQPWRRVYVVLAPDAHVPFKPLK